MTTMKRVLWAAIMSTALAAPVHAASVPGDITFEREGGTEGFAPGYFPHWVHRIHFRCYVCHDAIFPMKRGDAMTMEQMSAGKLCGTCHNGKVAWGLDECQRCHVGP